MLDLLAASYKNIGPLHDRAISLCFHAGTYLIKAPVGTGKSFLFFDGPIFSLYKYAPRPIRNRRSQEAYTQVLFMINKQVWLIHRVVYPTKKGGDSVKSSLYSLDIGGEEVRHLLSGYETFFDEPLIEIFSTYTHLVQTTNEKEVDAILLDLLPPKEVVLSAHFLMQDAENIFELVPGERLEVFKHIFGFIGIDHAKEKLREKRKELQTVITVKGDMSDLQQSFSSSFHELTGLITTLKKMPLSSVFLEGRLTSFLGSGFLADVSLLQGEIQLPGFVCDIDVSIIDDILLFIQEQRTANTRLGTKKEEIENQHRMLQQEELLLYNQIEQLRANQERLEKIITASSIGDMIVLQQEANQLQEKISAREMMYIERCIESGYEVQDFLGVVRILDDITSEGKQLQVTISTVIKDIETLQKHLQERNILLEKKQQQLLILQKDYATQSSFHCDKIVGNCPYVDVIKGASLRVLTVQRGTIEEEIDTLKEQMRQDGVYVVQQEILLEDMHKKKEAYLQLLIRLEWKQIYQAYEEHQYDQKQYRVLLDRIASSHKEQDKLQEQKKELANLQTQKNMLQQQLGTKEEARKKGELLLGEYNEQLQHIDIELLTSLATFLTTTKTLLTRLIYLVEQYEKRKVEVLILEEKQQKIKQLYTIFSKELLIIVLQDFLPIIQSTINSYLSEVAEYTLSFELEYTSSDTVNLEIYVEDNKGKRAVKSLSGGQKSLLKLAWIFSIATMLQLPFLFLDETITSLDAVTTSHVADVLYRFVQQFNTKLYVITHSPQIQDMHIWDKEVYIHF